MMRAPIELRKPARVEISGSRALFSIMVIPSASTAAIITFSVAPTLGYSKFTSAARSPSGALAFMKPWSSSTSAPKARRPSTWKLNFRRPRLHPPGAETSASPKRAASGPRTTRLARIWRTNS
jgi:hypothetical protein